MLVALVFFNRPRLAPVTKLPLITT
jgi:hypothetical protein